jgi:hypothetical protein
VSVLWFGSLVRPLEVVGLQVPVQRNLSLKSSTEVPPSEGDPPVLVQDRSLQSLDESVRPRMPWLRPRVAYTEFSACLIEVRFELTAPVG